MTHIKPLIEDALERCLQVAPSVGATRMQRWREAASSGPGWRQGYHDGSEHRKSLTGPATVQEPPTTWQTAEPQVDLLGNLIGWRRLWRMS